MFLKSIVTTPKTIQKTHTLKPLDRQMSTYMAADHPIRADSIDAASFLDAVDELAAITHEWAPMGHDKSSSSRLDRADELLQQAMFRCHGAEVS